MKHLSKILIALVLALTIAGTLPAQVFADSAPEYISEVKVYEGNCDNASAEGFTILCGEDGKPVDLNQGSGATGIGAKGNKKVFLGYKTTSDRKEAITDLAMMNMKGGYSVQEYTALMKDQMNKQIIPLIEGFLSAIEEYRENYNSANTANKERAQYIHDILNKITDDDCGGAGLGDLLLNETVYEMAKPKFEALSDKEKETTDLYDVNIQVRDFLPESEKNKHADILTIIAQSNGRATLMMENLITRAADTDDSTWLDRFAGITFADLADNLGLPPTDASMKLARMYDDDAKKILKMWGNLQEELEKYDSYIKTAENFDENELKEATDSIDYLNSLGEDASAEEKAKATEAYNKAVENVNQYVIALKVIYIHDILEGYDYEDGTLLDFFLIDEAEISDDISLLYPIVASLSEGQRSGLEFVSLEELILISASDPEIYKDSSFDKLEKLSIYDGVDRNIYQKGGVALTSDALRTDALSKMNENGFSLSGWTIASIVVTSACLLSAVAMGIVSKVYSNMAQGDMDAVTSGAKKWSDFKVSEEDATRFMDDVYLSNSATYKYLSIGFTVATVVFALVTTYLAYRDMVKQYKVDFTPIPHYMVDEKDITAYNEKGEKIVLKNQAAYYKAVECNRKKGDSYFDEIGTCADMNGCVNPQWLALYAAKNDAMNPILASSLKVVVGNNNLPAGYTTGIHMFGSGAASNLNNGLYCWNKSAKSVFVYFKVDTAANAANAAGSNFSGGTLIITGVSGFALGALISAFAAKATNKRRKKETA